MRVNDPTVPAVTTVATGRRRRNAARWKAPARRGTEAKAAIVEATIELLEESGEQGLRIAEVHRRTGISVGSIYHHFGDRDGLVKAARAEQFRASLPTYGAVVAELAGRARSVEEFVDGLGNVIRSGQAQAQRDERMRRVTYIASAATRPDLLEEVRSEQTDLISGGAEIAEMLIARGWVRSGVSARAFATLALALDLGAIVAQLDNERIDDEESLQVLLLAIGGLLNASGGKPGK